MVVFCPVLKMEFSTEPHASMYFGKPVVLTNGVRVVSVDGSDGRNYNRALQTAEVQDCESVDSYHVFVS